MYTGFLNARKTDSLWKERWLMRDERIFIVIFSTSSPLMGNKEYVPLNIHWYSFGEEKRFLGKRTLVSAVRKNFYRNFLLPVLH